MARVSGAGMAFVALERLINLQDGYRKLCRLQGRELLLLCEGGRTHLVENRCPHMGQPLHRASVVQGSIRCPSHGFEFDLASGRCTQGNCAPLGRYRLAYRGSEVGVDI